MYCARSRSTVEQEEIDVMEREHRWILAVEVPNRLRELLIILKECRRRFTMLSTVEGSASVVKSEKFVLNNPQGAQNVKSVLTLLGCDITDADLTLRLTQQGQSTRIYKTAINADSPWRLQQLQDAGNQIMFAIEDLNIVHNSQLNQCFQVLKLIQAIRSSLSSAKSVLLMPRRKTNEELLKNRNMACLKPTLPKDVAFSFYIYGHKLALAVYQFNSLPNTDSQYPRCDVLQRYQVECVIPWLKEALVLLTYSLQICQNLTDKLLLFSEISKTPSPCKDTNSSA